MIQEESEFDEDCCIVSVGISCDCTFYPSNHFNFSTTSSDPHSLTLHLSHNSNTLKLSKDHIREVIITEESSIYIKTKNRPPLTTRKNRGHQTRSSYRIFLPKAEDYLTSILFPHFLVLKFQNCASTQQIKSHLENWKIKVEPGYFIEEPWQDRPTFSSLFENPSIDSSVKYFLLTFLTNSLMKLEDLSQRTIEAFAQAGEDNLTELFNTGKEFSLNSLENLRFSRTYNRKRPNFQIKRVNITPTAIVFFPPTNEKGNRVIRKYSEISQLFLRVNFSDESLEKRNWSSNFEVVKSFRSVLDELRILDLEYEFLGFSSSQMRNHSCWMIVKTADSWADQIRADLGDFSECKTIAKYSARLGLCFSETQKTLNVPELRIQEISDIERNGFKFSDGIGKISPEYLLESRHILNINENEEICAVQIRLGGCKGVLVLAPELENCIKIRPSMRKFKSPALELEVCSFAKYKPAFLNRQIILLLHGLGVNESVFLSMQRKEVLEARNMLQEDINQFYRRIFEKGIISDFKIMNKGLTDKGYLFKAYLREIQSRARIPAEDSALLMGVMDEYGLLKPKETYIRISVDGKSVVVTGTVVVAKNPCLHPGDVRVLSAVNYPELAHLVNVVVFSQNGERPIPDECSGSDLDGDEYFVTWNKYLIQIEEAQATNYIKEEGISNIRLDGDCIKDYFVDFMKSEILGRITNLHIMYADRKGIFSEEALYYAGKAAKAVDYPKTGKRVSDNELEKPNQWPDFLEKNYMPSYESPGIIGKLYRQMSHFIGKTLDAHYSTPYV